MQSPDRGRTRAIKDGSTDGPGFCCVRRSARADLGNQRFVASQASGHNLSQPRLSKTDIFAAEGGSPLKCSRQRAFEDAAETLALGIQG